MTISHDNLYNLPEISFIGGTDKTFTFTPYQSDGTTYISVIGATISWQLCPYGEYNITLLEKTGTVIDSHTFTVVIDAADTLYLSGKYVQQILVTDFTGKLFKPAQGIVIILPAIQAA